MARRKSSWPVAEAKAGFSELIDQATLAGPQTITRHGRPVAMVVSVDEWQRKTRRKGNLAEFFARSPLRDAGLDVARDSDPPRPLDL